MKKAILIIIILNLVLGLGILTGCTKKDDAAITDKPTFEKDNSAEDQIEEDTDTPEGYAGRTDFFIVEDLGVKVSMYYSFEGREFKGTATNTTGESVSGLKIEVNQIDGRIKNIGEPLFIKPDETKTIECYAGSGGVTAWRVLLSIEKEDGTIITSSDPKIQITDRYKDSEGKILTAAVVIPGAEFQSMPNRGVVFGSAIYAKFNQEYTLVDNGLEICLHFDPKTNCFVGNLTNTKDIIAQDFSIIVNYEVEYASLLRKGIVVKPNSSIPLRIPCEFDSSLGNPFKIWRPSFLFYGADRKKNDEKEDLKITIKDL